MEASWETVTGGDLVGVNGLELYDVAVVAGGYVAVALDGFTAVLTSPDGVTWTKVPTDPGFNNTQMVNIEPSPDGTLIGVGIGLSPQVFAAWKSVDGISWVQQPTANGAVLTGVPYVYDFAAYPGGYVAVGLVDNNGDFDAAWWTSPDGTTWTAGTIAEPGVQQMLGVTVSDGLMVAAGETRPNTGIWTAPVGGTFSRVDHVNLSTAVSDFDPSNTAARVFAWDIAAGGPGFVAVGADQTTVGTSEAAVWTSPDGTQWTRFGNETQYTPTMLHADFAGRPPWTVMDTVINSGGTLIVAGRTGTPGDPDLIIWESTDGFTWRQGPVGLLPQAIRPLNAVAHDNKLIIVGITNGITQTTTSEGAVWVATPDPDPPQIGTWRQVPAFETTASGWFGRAVTVDDRIIAVGRAGGVSSFVWGSTDGLGWTRLPGPTAPPGQIVGLSGITFIDGAYYATGFDPACAIWWSTDLTTWQRATTPVTGSGRMENVRQIRGELVAYGHNFDGPSPTPEIWVSSDGITWIDTNADQTLGHLNWMGGLVETRTGQSVLAGYNPTSDATEVWISPAGAPWTQVANDPSFAGFWPELTVIFENRLVIAGGTTTNGIWTPAILASEDLATWDLVVLDGVPATEGDVHMVSVVGSRLIVSGSTAIAAGDHHPALWSTGDLTFWTRSDPLPTAGGVNDQIALPGLVADVVRIGDQLVAVGQSLPIGQTWQATVWTSDNP